MREPHTKHKQVILGGCSVGIQRSRFLKLTPKSFPAHLHSSRLEGVAGQAIYKTVQDRMCENVPGEHTEPHTTDYDAPCETWL